MDRAGRNDDDGRENAARDRPAPESNASSQTTSANELPHTHQATEKRYVSQTPTPSRAIPKPTYYTPQPRRKPPILSPRPDKKILLKKSPSTSSSLKSSISRSTGQSDGSIKEREQFNPFPEELPTESEYDCDSYSRPPSPTSMTSSSVSENSPLRIPSVEKRPSTPKSDSKAMAAKRLNPVERRYSQRLTPTSSPSPSELSQRYFTPQPRRKANWIPNSSSSKPDSPITPSKPKDWSPRSKSPVARQLFTSSPNATPQPPAASSIPKKNNFFKERSRAVYDISDGAETLELKVAQQQSKSEMVGGNISDISSIGYPNGKSSDISRTPSICYQSDKDSQSDSYMYENLADRRRRRRRSAGSMSLRSLAASREVLNDIFQSGRKENKKMKGVLGLCVAIFLGAILFIGLHYGLYYTEVVSVIITAASTFFIALGLAFSVRSRCIAALMAPTLCTSRGRAAVLALTLGLLLNGPIKNIVNNGNQLSEAMTCNADVLNQHSEQIQEAALKSFDDYVENVEASLETLESIATDIQESMEPLTEGILRVNDQIENAANALTTSAETCINMLNDAYDECKIKINSVYEDCKRRLGIDINGICAPLGITDVFCEAVKIGTEICRLPTLGDDIFDIIIIDGIEEAVEELVDMFEVNVDFVPTWQDARVNFTGDPKAIAEKISAKLEDTFGTFDIIILFLDRLVAFSVVYLLYRSYRYHSNYVTKDRFDNFYITKEFRKFDKHRFDNGQESILPLKKYEKKKMIDVTTLALSHPEKGSFKIGLASVLLKALITATIILVDYGFYWLLTVMQSLYKEINYSASGGGDLSYNIEGNGLMAEFARNLYGEGPQDSNTYEIQSQAQKCIPKPLKPEDNTAIIIGVLYGVIILTVLFQAYALRLRRWIASYYYPEREQARTMYLYNKTLRKRRTLWSMLKQTIKENRREQVAVERISFRSWLAAQNKFCRIILGNTSRVCLGCATEENKSFYICDNTRCSGAYCGECLEQVDSVCALCGDPIDIESGVNTRI
ncbi:DC-STAMP domain-containing protein 2-like [Antedon mediterranea]|uniref:DC-STAMP domain-containing protein 2-like n=1 Tax=Antedon mediterranea TaxID=105859 RepID=UPI003AF4BE7E